jgi:hypothetical protein
MEPHRGNELVDVQSRRRLPQLLFMAGEPRLALLIGLAEYRHLDGTLQPDGTEQVFDAGAAIHNLRRRVERPPIRIEGFDAIGDAHRLAAAGVTAFRAVEQQ